MTLIALRSVELGVTDVAAATRFYMDVWGLAPVASPGGAVVISAVIDALAPVGVRSLDMPATRERVWQAIRAAQAA